MSRRVVFIIAAVLLLLFFFIFGVPAMRVQPAPLAQAPTPVQVSLPYIAGPEPTPEVVATPVPAPSPLWRRPERGWVQLPVIAVVGSEVVVRNTLDRTVRWVVVTRVVRRPDGSVGDDFWQYYELPILPGEIRYYVFPTAREGAMEAWTPPVP